MKVKNLVQTKSKAVVSIDAAKSVEEAIRLMHKKKISAVIVIDNKETVGIFTERDMVRCYVSKKEGTRFREIPVRDAMTTHPELVGGTRDRLDTSLARALPRRLVVKGGAEGLRGIGVLADATSRTPASAIALKVEDGAGMARASWAATVEALRAAATLGRDAFPRLETRDLHTVNPNGGVRPANPSGQAPGRPLFPRTPFCSSFRALSFSTKIVLPEKGSTPV